MTWKIDICLVVFQDHTDSMMQLNEDCICQHSVLRRKRKPTPVPLLGKSHGQRSLVGYSPWGYKELDKTEQLHFTFSVILPNVRYILYLYILAGEGNGTPFQYSCLENPMEGGAWWAAVHGVAVGHN